MSINVKSLSEKIKELRNKKGFSLEEISEKIPISKQGYHFWEQGLRSWKLEILTILSKILDFTLIINDGTISISENKTTMKDNEVKSTMKEIVEEYINLENAIHLDDRYCIIELYTIKQNIDLKEEQIINPLLVFKTKETVMNVANYKKLVPIYTLYDKEIGHLFEKPNIHIKDVYNFYYSIFAPELDENRTLYINTEKNIKISKRFLIEATTVDNNRNEKTSLLISKHKNIEPKYEEVEYDLDMNEEYITFSFKPIEESEEEKEHKIRQLKELALKTYDKNDIGKINEVNQELKEISDDNYIEEFNILPFKEKGKNIKMSICNDFKQIGNGLTIFRVTDLDDNILKSIDNIHFEFPYELLY